MQRTIPVICALLCRRYFSEWGSFSRSPRAIIPFRTGDLSLVSYLRNADRAGWNFCLEREHGSATTVCANTFVDAIQKFLSPLLVAEVFNCGDFHYSVYVQTGDLKRPATFNLLSAPLTQTRIFRSYQC